jgi:hypothetical protein
MTQFSILLNGSPSSFINSLHRLKQGDPFSPLLFVIIMEALSMMISATVNRGLFIWIFGGIEGS